MVIDMSVKFYVSVTRFSNILTGLTLCHQYDTCPLSDVRIVSRFANMNLYTLNSDNTQHNEALV